MRQTATHPIQHHQCRFTPWGSDPRYQRCACGETRRVVAPVEAAATQAPRFTMGQRVRIAAQPGCSATVRGHDNWPGEVLLVSRAYNGHRFYRVRLRSIRASWGGWLAAISVRECDLAAMVVVDEPGVEGGQA